MVGHGGFQIKPFIGVTARNQAAEVAISLLILYQANRATPGYRIC